MPNRLADAVSPYLRGHAGNPVDWWPWGEEAFAEAERRDVPVLVSIGYATCHWCHVMARESFSDDALAAYLNENFVSVKVDREEHPDVDAGYLAAAAAFTRNLGWPLNVFTTPGGRVFFAGTYSPPLPMQGHPSFRQLLEAVTDAWANRRDGVEQTADAVAGALAEQPAYEAAEGVPDLAVAVAALAAQEDALYGGFGAAPKFPVAPVFGFLLAVPEGRKLAARTLHRMAASPLRDPIEGGFFRYSTLRDWGDPHYERMLYDNAQLLGSFAELGRGGDAEAVEIADGIGSYLLTVLRLPSGAFASAQDSESDIDGTWSEGGYYRATASERATLKPPRLDEKVLTGWNGLAIGALARAGFVLDRPDWVRAAGVAADYLLERHVVGRHDLDGRLVRVSLGDRVSDAVATLEDYGMLAGGLLQLALAGGGARYAVAGRALIDAVLAAPESPTLAIPFTVPGGPDPVLASRGLALPLDPSEGAYPSGLSACAHAALTLYELTADARYLDAATRTAAVLSAHAVASPLGFGTTLELLTGLAAEHTQLVVVMPDAAPAASELVAAARAHLGSVTALVTQATASELAAVGFELFAARTAIDGLPTGYLCRDFTCRLPVTTAEGLRES